MSHLTEHWPAKQFKRGPNQMSDLEKLLVRTSVSIGEVIWLLPIVSFWISWFTAQCKAVLVSERRKKGCLCEDREWPFHTFCGHVHRDCPTSAGFLLGGGGATGEVHLCLRSHQDAH